MKIVNSLSCGPSFGPFWSIKYFNFEQNLPILTAHHTSLESKLPKVTKNPFNVLFLEGSQKKVPAHGLYVIIRTICDMNLYFMHYLHVVIVFFSTSLFYILNSISFLIMSDLITFFNFLLTLFKWSVKTWELWHAINKENIYLVHLSRKI